MSPMTTIAEAEQAIEAATGVIARLREVIEQETALVPCRARCAMPPRSDPQRPSWQPSSLPVANG